MPAFIHKKSSIGSDVPSTSELSLGEIAINTYDGKLFTKKTGGGTAVVEITNATHTGEVTGSGALTITDNAVVTAKILDDNVTAAKLANSINTDIATGVTASTTAGNALPKAGGTMSGDIAMGDNDISNIKSIAFNDGDATITEVKDEDNMASDSATMLATQQSIKAYVDAKAGDVTKVSTPADNQVGVWTGDGTIEGTAYLTFNGSLLDVRGDINIGASSYMTLTDNEIDISSGDLLIDVAGDIEINTDGGQVHIKDSTTGAAPTPNQFTFDCDTTTFKIWDAGPYLMSLNEDYGYLKTVTAGTAEFPVANLLQFEIGIVDASGSVETKPTCTLNDLLITSPEDLKLNAGNGEIQFHEDGVEIAAMASVSGTVHIMSMGGTAANSGNGVGFRYNAGEMEYRNSNHSSSTWTTFDALGLSDQKVKNSISNFNTGLSLINQLQPKNYKYNEDYRIAYHLEEENRVGMIAQDLQSISDNYVKLSSSRLGLVEIEPGLDDSEKYLKPSELFEQELQGALINAIKELSTKNDALEARLAILEAA